MGNTRVEWKKKYSIKETTKVEREKIVQDAYAIAISTGEPPTEEMMQLIQKYVDGKKGNIGNFGRNYSKIS